LQIYIGLFFRATLTGYPFVGWDFPLVPFWRFFFFRCFKPPPFLLDLFSLKPPPFFFFSLLPKSVFFPVVPLVLPFLLLTLPVFPIYNQVVALLAFSLSDPSSSFPPPVFRRPFLFRLPPFFSPQNLVKPPFPSLGGFN